MNLYLHRNIFFILIFCLITPQLSAQNTQKGGFIYGWENYDESNINGVGSRTVNFDSTELRSIPHAPPEGVHPRVFFGPDEIPDILNRLHNTSSGQVIKKLIHAYTSLMHMGTQDYDINANYARDDFNNRLIGNIGFWNVEPHYSLLVNEDPAVWDGVTVKRKHMTACMMAFEAFECLLFAGTTDSVTNMSYTQRADKLSTAMTFWATLALDDPNVNPDSDNFNQFGGTHMALAYDLHYNSMTTAQQDLVREALVKIIPEEPRHGAFLPAFANTSNWTTLNSFEIIPNLAIEGEPGYKPNLTERWMRTYHSFINYGWYPSGAGYEGLGKNYQYVTTMIACAKRGYSLLSHPHVRAYGEEFLPSITQPFGHSFTSYDVWGGSGSDAVSGGYKFSAADAVGLKWAFPDSKPIDFVWRNYIEKWTGDNSVGYTYQHIRPDDSYYNYLLPAAIFASNYEEGDWNAQAVEVINENYFAADRGLAVLRSGTDSDDLSVQFHCRQDMGGHTHGDRNDFTLSANGRIWIRKSYGGSQFQPSWFHSTILIDDQGVAVGDPDGDKCRQPGKIVDWKSNNDISLIAGDATYAYNWDWHWSPQSEGNDHPWLGSNGWEPVTETWNDFQFEPKTEPHFDIPFYEFPHWHQASKYERMVKRQVNNVEKAIRTTAMVKGSTPFVLIVDDLKNDETIHNYKWLAQIARDLTIEETVVNLENENYRNDVILMEPAAIGNRRLLVRILENTGYDGTNDPAIIDTLGYTDYFTGAPYNSNPSLVRPRLIVESNSVTPQFKVMLFPFEVGTSLPVTHWNETRDTLTIFPDLGEEKRITFIENEEGRTEISILDETVNNIDQPTLEMEVFPNPASNYLTLRFSVPQPPSLFVLTDASGKIVDSQEVSGISAQINIAQLPKGVYFYVLKNDRQQVESGKVTIQ